MIASARLAIGYCTRLQRVPSLGTYIIYKYLLKFIERLQRTRGWQPRGKKRQETKKHPTGGSIVVVVVVVVVVAAAAVVVVQG